MWDTIIIGVFLGGMFLMTFQGYRDEKQLRQRMNRYLDECDERYRNNVGRIPPALQEDDDETSEEAH